MTEESLDTIERRPSASARGVEPQTLEPWTELPPRSEELCTIIDSRYLLESDDPALLPPWPGDPSRSGSVAELWEHPPFRREFATHLRRCLQGKEQHYETLCQLTGAGWRRFEINLYPRQESGDPRALVLLRDVTERRRAESHLQLLLQIVHILSVSPDLSVAITAILKKLCAVSTWPVGEVWVPTPDGSIELFCAAHRADCPDCERFLRATGGLRMPVDRGLLSRLWTGGPVRVTDLAADREFFRASAAERAGFRAAFVVPLRAGDETLGLMVFFWSGDIPSDERWMALAHAVAVELAGVFERERVREQLDSFFTRSLDLHCLAGFDGFLKRVNPAWTRLLGYSGDELLRRPLVELVHPDDRALFLENLGKLGRGEDLTSLELRCLHQDGTVRWTLWNATSLPNQHLVVATSRDITERKRSEQAVAQSEEHYRDLFHQAYQMQENLRRLSNRILQVQEQERARISRDLHDEVGQALTAINMNLAVLRNSLAASPPDIERRIGDTQALIEQTMVSIHNFSRELRPAILDDLGLLPALRNHIKAFSERTGLDVRLHPTQPDSIEQLDSERKIVVYRVVQEGLNNVARHACARKVDIAIAGSVHDVRLQINDDGRGFSLEPRPDSAPRQLGLLGLAERVRLVGGEFNVASVPGRGTTLRAAIPFKFV